MSLVKKTVSLRTIGTTWAEWVDVTTVRPLGEGLGRSFARESSNPRPARAWAMVKVTTGPTLGGGGTAERRTEHSTALH
jgi:hypothetical protein